MVLFAVPTLLIMGSWGSLPGDLMYPVKLGLEQVLLLAARPSYAAEASLNVKYTTRRLTDAKVLLANDQSGKGLSYLSQQVIATQAVINRAPDPVTKQKLAEQYIATLQTASSELSQQRQQIAITAGTNAVSPSALVGSQATLPTEVTASRGTTVPAMPTASPQHIVAPTQTGSQNANRVIVPTAVPTVGTQTASTTSPQDSSPVAVVSQIDATQEQIQQTIDQLQAAVQSAPEESKHSDTTTANDHNANGQQTGSDNSGNHENDANNAKNTNTKNSDK